MTGEPIKDWAFLADGSSGDKSLECEWLKVAQQIFELWQQRQKKYGPANIAAFGEKGCLVRAFDKTARLRQALFNGQGAEMPDGTIEDSWADLVNYALMGILCRRKLWPNG